MLYDLSGDYVVIMLYVNYYHMYQFEFFHQIISKRFNYLISFVQNWLH